MTWLFEGKSRIYQWKLEIIVDDICFLASQFSAIVFNFVFWPPNLARPVVAHGFKENVRFVWEHFEPIWTFNILADDANVFVRIWFSIVLACIFKCMCSCHLMLNTSLMITYTREHVSMTITFWQLGSWTHGDLKREVFEYSCPML